MADITLLEAAKHSQDELERAVTKIIVETSPILEYLPMKTINGPAFRYHKERTLGTVAFRGVGGTYTPDAGVINPEFEPLVILGGEVKVDNFEVEVMSNLLNLKAEKYRMKARQAGIKFQDAFGKQQIAYAGTPIRIVRREDDGSTFLGYDEDPGDGTSDTASVYCIRFSSDHVHGIQSKSLPSVKDFGEVQAGPYPLGRIEWYCGVVVKHPRGAARLYGILDA